MKFKPGSLLSFTTTVPGGQPQPGRHLIRVTGIRDGRYVVTCTWNYVAWPQRPASCPETVTRTVSFATLDEACYAV